MAKKAAEAKTCDITRQQFMDKGPSAKEVMTLVANRVDLEKKERFTSGGFGYYGGGKITVEIDGKPVKLQVGLNVTVVNSKCSADAKAE